MTITPEESDFVQTAQQVVDSPVLWVRHWQEKGPEAAAAVDDFKFEGPGVSVTAVFQWIREQGFATWELYLQTLDHVENTDGSWEHSIVLTRLDGNFTQPGEVFQVEAYA